MAVLVACCVLYVATLWPQLGADLSVAARLLFLPLAIGMMLAVLGRARTGRPPGSGLRLGAAKRGAFGRHSSRVTQLIGLVSLVSLGVSLVVSPGTPVSEDGQFFISNHANHAQVSEHAYLVARSWQTRQYLSGAALAATFLLMYLDTRRSRSDLTGEWTPSGR